MKVNAWLFRFAVSLILVTLTGCMEPGADSGAAGDESYAQPAEAPSVDLPLPGGRETFTFVQHGEDRGTVQFHSDGSVLLDFNDAPRSSGNWQWDGEDILLFAPQADTLRLSPHSDGSYTMDSDPSYGIQIVP